MHTATRIEEVRHEVGALASAVPAAKVFMQAICKLLHERMLKYNWVGFYMLEPGTQPPVLVLETFVGAMTPHTRIPLNQGIPLPCLFAGDEVGNCCTRFRERRSRRRTRY